MQWHNYCYSIQHHATFFIAMAIVKKVILILEVSPARPEASLEAELRVSLDDNGDSR